MPLLTEFIDDNVSILFNSLV